RGRQARSRPKTMTVLSLILLAGWLLALVRTVLNLRAIPKLVPRLVPEPPLVSVIIPARNEERSIERTVRAFLDQTYSPLEVIVIDDRSGDGTGSILGRLAAEDPRLTLVHGEETPAGWLGKPWALHQGSLRARGELFLFVDADITYQPDAVAAAVAHIRASGSGLVSLLPRIVMRGFWEHVLMPNLGVVLFTVLPVWLTNRTSRFPMFAVGGGPGNLIRRDVYAAIGGHERLKNAVIDDIGMARLVRRAGHATELVRADQWVAVRMYHGGREVVEGFTKNVFPALGRSYLLAAVLIPFVALFHAGPYVLALAGDRISLATIALISLLRLGLFVKLKYGAVNGLLGHPLMILGWGWITLRSIWFTGVRRQVHWRGRRYDAGTTRFGDE
ncbi:MAG: glycosyltransferase, partial [Thermoanaerobaculia bacterium]